MSNEVLEILEKTQGLLKGHFCLTSGLHSDEYFQCAKLYQYPEYTEKLGINERVIFSGFVDDVSEIMNITDINVNCSIGTETSSLALSEGMSLGIPAIASDYAGNKYIVKNRVNGLIFRQRDHVDLAKKILFLVKNKSVYDEFSINARKRFLSELNAKNMTDKTERYYMYLLHKKGIFKDFL